MMRSSAQRDRCTDRIDAQAAVSSAKSLSDTASMEFGEAPPAKPSAAASAGRSSPKACPASAPEPSGITSSRASASSRRPKSRCHAHACESSQCDHRTGCAGCRCV